jgi:hypothetical protein
MEETGPREAVNAKWGVAGLGLAAFADAASPAVLAAGDAVHAS